MSNKGVKHTPATRGKISKSMTKYSNAHLIKTAQEYINQLEANPKQLPTISGYCIHSGISRSHLLERIADSPELANIIDHIEMLQEEFALTNGILGKANPIFSIFLLKSKHKYLDQPQQLTQNNSFNISPDLLAEAIKTMNKK